MLLKFWAIGFFLFRFLLRFLRRAIERIEPDLVAVQSYRHGTLNRALRGYIVSIIRTSRRNFANFLKGSSVFSERKFRLITLAFSSKPLHADAGCHPAPPVFRSGRHVLNRASRGRQSCAGSAMRLTILSESVSVFALRISGGAAIGAELPQP
jgi:hypothetical protein